MYYIDPIARHKSQYESAKTLTVFDVNVFY